MNTQKALLFGIALALIAGSGALVQHLRKHQKLGRPGVKTRPIDNSGNLLVLLPETVLDYQSEPVEVPEIVTHVLPPDTSYGQRVYRVSSNSAPIIVNAVLMGSDRTSLHKPQFCLEGHGFRIDHSATLATNITVERPFPYSLPVVRLIASQEVSVNHEQKTVKAVYVYWYVADGSLSASVSGWGRMWSMTRELVHTGQLQRWACISCLTSCSPGTEEAAFARIREFLSAAVPEFQLTPAAAGSIATRSN